MPRPCGDCGRGTFAGLGWLAEPGDDESVPVADALGATSGALASAPGPAAPSAEASRALDGSIAGRSDADADAASPGTATGGAAVPLLFGQLGGDAWRGVAEAGLTAATGTADAGDGTAVRTSAVGLAAVPVAEAVVTRLLASDGLATLAAMAGRSCPAGAPANRSAGCRADGVANVAFMVAARPDAGWVAWTFAAAVGGAEENAAELAIPSADRGAGISGEGAPCPSEPPAPATVCPLSDPVAATAAAAATGAPTAGDVTAGDVTAGDVTAGPVEGDGVDEAGSLGAGRSGGTAIAIATWGTVGEAGAVLFLSGLATEAEEMETPSARDRTGDAAAVAGVLPADADPDADMGVAATGRRCGAETTWNPPC